LKPGVSLEQGQEDLSTIAAGLAVAHPVDQAIGVLVARVSDTRVGELRPMLFLLMGAVSLILLIACVNLANLLLARNSARQRELAVRAALGAGRDGLVRQLLAETLLLSLIG
jgi:putative ABC transport system permease protein